MQLSGTRLLCSHYGDGGGGGGDDDNDDGGEGDGDAIFPFVNKRCHFRDTQKIF